MTRTYRLKKRADSAAATRARIRDVSADLLKTRPIVDITLGEIAAQAKATVRTVLRLFGNKERLFAEAAQAGEEKGLGDPVRPGDVAEAVRLLCAAYEEFGDDVVRRVADARHIPALIAQFETGRRGLRVWVERVFAPQLASVRGARRDDLLSRLLVLADVHVWKILRRDQKHPPKKVEEILRDMIAAQLKGVRS